MLRRLTTARSAKVIVFLLLFAMASRASVDPDMWWHLRVGDHILETGEFVYVDSFSHTLAGNLHKNHSPLAQIVMVGAWRLGGHLGLTLFVSGLATAGMYFVYRAGRGTIYLQGFILVIGAACAAAFWSPRPQMFTFLFCAMLVFLLYDLKRRGRDRLWLLPLLFWLWGNCHGGYIIGYLLIAAFALGEWLNNFFCRGDSRVPTRLLKKLTALSLLSIALVLINPLGVEILSVPFETIGISGLRSHITEWKSPDFSEPFTWGFLILLVLLGVSVGMSRRRFDFTEFILVGGSLLMALYSGRNLSLFAIATVPVVTVHFDQLLLRKGWTIPYRAQESVWRAVINLLLIGLVAIGTLAHVQYVTDDMSVSTVVSMNWPVDAVGYLNASTLEGNLFNSYNWGGYLIYAAPRFPVFIDGRTDLYRDFLDEYAAAIGTESWRGIFGRWDIGIVLIETNSELAYQLDAAAEWQREYQDNLASIYVRAQP